MMHFVALHVGGDLALCYLNTVNREAMQSLIINAQGLSTVVFTLNEIVNLQIPSKICEFIKGRTGWKVISASLLSEVVAAC